MSDRSRQLEAEASDTARTSLAFLRSQDKLDAQGVGVRSSAVKRILSATVPAIADSLRAIVAHRSCSPAIYHPVHALGPEVVAFVGLNSALAMCLREKKATRSTIVSTVGSSVRHEMSRQLFADAAPGLMKKLLHRSNKERMSMRKADDTMKRIASTQGIDLSDMDGEAIAKVGGAIMQAAMEAGLFKTELAMLNIAGRVQRQVYVTIEPGILETIRQSREAESIFHGNTAPMVCPPDDWQQDGTGGGRLSPVYKQYSKCQIASFAGRITLSNKALEAINALQSVRFRVDSDMLRAVSCIVSAKGAGWIVGEVKDSPPEFPAGMPEWGQRTPEQKERLREWSRQKRQWHEAHNTSVARSRTLIQSIGMAQRLQGEDAIWMPVRCDWRGRMYYDAYPLNPQGHQVQRGMIQFANGVQITGDAERWMMRNLASRFGEDKCSADDQVSWTDKMSGQICACADDPISNTMWRDADEPLQFLQAAIEWKKYVDDREGFRSHAPVHLDGSCNGLQHLSAMSRNQDMAEFVNISGGDRKDIYTEAARIMAEMIAADPNCPADIKALFQSVPRAVVKPTVMNIPNGLRISSSTSYLHSRGLPGSKLPINPDEYWRIAKHIAAHLWNASTQACAPVMDAMKQLAYAAKSLIDDQHRIIWTTADGCEIVMQAHSQNLKQVQTRWGRVTVLEVGQPRRKTTGFQPDFVHSCDADHMRSVIRDMVAAGHTSLWMVHDSFGCQPTDATFMQETILRRFAWLHGDIDPFARLFDSCGVKLPARGCYDTNSIIGSDYAFR